MRQPIRAVTDRPVEAATVEEGADDGDGEEEASGAGISVDGFRNSGYIGGTGVYAASSTPCSSNSKRGAFSGIGTGYDTLNQPDPEQPCLLAFQIYSLL